MKYWTVQSKNVIDIIVKEGIYQPDFSKSRYLDENDRVLIDLYSELLESFNRMNGMDLPGLVFSFAAGVENMQPVEDFYDFKEFIRSKSMVLFGMWYSFDKSNSVVMELEYDDSFNPILIDINDFQVLMPPNVMVPPFTEESLVRIHNSIRTGVYSVSEFESGVIQAHLPFIKKENLIRVHPFFALD